MIEINIDSKKLAAIALLASKADVRHYLNGVYVEATATQTRLAATNGHYLGLHAKCNPLDYNAWCEWEALVIPNDVIAKLGKPSKTVSAICTVLIDTPNPFEGSTKEADTKKYTLRTWDGVLIPFIPIDGKFPDLRRIVPKGSASGVAVQVDAEYLTLFAKVNKTLGAAKPGFLSIGHHGDNMQGKVTIKLSDPYFVGVLMGVRNDEALHQTVLHWPDAGADPVADGVPASEHEEASA